MDRQARKLTSSGKEGENGSENGSELGSNTDSESEEKVRSFNNFINCNAYALVLQRNVFFLFYFFLIFLDFNEQYFK